MKQLLPIAACLALVPVAALAAPGGVMKTIPNGAYTCELPGDATGPAGLRQPAAEFSIVTGSSYSADGAMGSYLLTGDSVVFTSGPRKGQRFRRAGNRTLHLLGPDGRETSLRCVNGG